MFTDCFLCCRIHLILQVIFYVVEFTQGWDWVAKHLMFEKNSDVQLFQTVIHTYFYVVEFTYVNKLVTMLYNSHMLTCCFLCCRICPGPGLGG